MCDRRVLQLRCAPESVAVGRRFVAETFGAWGVGSGEWARVAGDDLLLIASELLANAVRFCTGDLTLAVDGHHDRVRVTVADGSPQPAVMRHAAAEATAGRGLPIIEMVAQRWGQRPYDGTTKDVWAEIGVPAATPLSLQCRRRLR